MSAVKCCQQMFQVDLPSDIVMNLNLPVIYYLLVKSIFFVLVKVFSMFIMLPVW